MPRLFAPAGATGYSHNGHSFEVDADGSVDVSDLVAADLRDHGFTPAAPPPSEAVSVKRSDLLAALEKMGVAANPDMDADKLAAALTAAVAVTKPEVKRASTLTLGNKGAT